MKGGIAMQLVIAEKPSVGRSVASVIGATEKKDGYLEGNGYIVTWCIGHLVQLASPDKYDSKYGTKISEWSFSTLPILPEHWKFVVSSTTKQQFQVIQELMQDSRVDEIICATDAGREGECIFRYVYEKIGCTKPCKRLWISSMEDKAIREGFSNLRPDSDYDNLYAAGLCRAKADWLVGLNSTRLFTCRYGTLLSIGRVQTPTLAMIVQRDYDVKHFVKQKFFTVELDCGTFVASSERIDEEESAKNIAESCSGKTATISEIKKEIKTVNPPKLYDLTTLQREANRQYGYTAQQALDYTQSLYEQKLVTYPRTDSQYLTEDMEQTAADLIQTICNTISCCQGLSIPEPNVKRCINNSKVSDHHAIIPTAEIAHKKLADLPDGERNILNLIAAKLILATADPHRYEATKVSVICENHNFSATGKAILNAGWKAFEIAIKEIVYKKATERKQVDDSIAVGKDLSIKKLSNWKELEDDEIRKTIKAIVEELETQKYEPGFFQKIILTFFELQDYEIMRNPEETYSRIISAMGEKLKKDDGKFKKSYLEINSNDTALIERYNALIEPLLKIFEEKENEAVKDFSFVHEDWNDIFPENCKKNSKDFLKNGKFFCYFELEKFINKLKEVPVKEIYNYSGSVVKTKI